jgi:hypothetical protein
MLPKAALQIVTTRFSVTHIPTGECSKAISRASVLLVGERDGMGRPILAAAGDAAIGDYANGFARQRAAPQSQFTPQAAL